MKKLLLLLILSLSLVLAGCGDGVDNEADSQEPAESPDAAADEQEKDEEESMEEEPEENKDYYFDGETAETEDVKIVIKETKVIPVGEEGNEYGETPVFAVWYDVTNKSDDDIDPNTAWIALFEAIQDNDPNAVNTLNVGSLPDEAHLDSQMQTIKKDGTVENSTSYELDDETTPVTLVATKGVMGEELGRKEYKID